MLFAIQVFQVNTRYSIEEIDMVIVLAESLKKNTTLRTVKIDKNKITVTGYSSLRFALRYNTTLQNIPFPHQDFTLVCLV